MVISINYINIKNKLKPRSRPKAKLSVIDGIRSALGIVFIIAGTILAAYVSIYIMFVGGIIQIINAIRSVNVVPTDIAIGIARISFSTLVGYMIFVLSLAIGTTVLESRK